MSDRYDHLERHADLGEGTDEFEGPRRFTRPSERYANSRDVDSILRAARAFGSKVSGKPYKASGQISPGQEDAPESAATDFEGDVHPTITKEELVTTLTSPTDTIHPPADPAADMLLDTLAAIQPRDVDDLLDLAGLVGDVDGGHITAATVVTR